MLDNMCTVIINPFRTTRFQLVQKLSFFQILLPLGCKTTCRCPHVNTTFSFQEIFGGTHVPIVLKGKLHTFLNIFIDNEISTLNAIIALIKFTIISPARRFAIQSVHSCFLVQEINTTHVGVIIFYHLWTWDSNF